MFRTARPRGGTAYLDSRSRLTARASTSPQDRATRCRFWIPQPTRSSRRSPSDRTRPGLGCQESGRRLQEPSRLRASMARGSLRSSGRRLRNFRKFSAAADCDPTPCCARPSQVRQRRQIAIGRNIGRRIGSRFASPLEARLERRQRFRAVIGAACTTPRVCRIIHRSASFSAPSSVSIPSTVRRCFSAISPSSILPQARLCASRLAPGRRRCARRRSRGRRQSGFAPPARRTTRLCPA